jgi:hypothetical protein
MRLHVPYGLAMWAEDGGGAVTEIKVVEATSMSWWPLCWLIDNIDDDSSSYLDQTARRLVD